MAIEKGRGATVNGESQRFNLPQRSVDGDWLDLAMQEGAPSFSRILLSDMTFVPTDPEAAENGSGKIGSIELVNPSPETAGWVASLFSEDEVHGDLVRIVAALKRLHVPDCPPTGCCDTKFQLVSVGVDEEVSRRGDEHGAEIHGHVLHIG